MMERALTGFAAGAVGGVLAGLLLSLLVWWGKDLRDARLKAAGIPLPSDRVFPAYHWPIAALGALQGTIIAVASDVSPIWAALSIFAIPALFLPSLALSGLFALLRPSRAPRDFDPGVVVGKDLEEANGPSLPGERRMRDP